MDNRNLRPNNRPPNQSSVRTDPITHSYQKYYELLNLEFFRPRQSGFVSSTTCTDDDIRYYRDQTIQPMLRNPRGEVQDKTVSSSSKNDS